MRQLLTWFPWSHADKGWGLHFFVKKKRFHVLGNMCVHILLQGSDLLIRHLEENSWWVVSGWTQQCAIICCRCLSSNKRWSFDEKTCSASRNLKLETLLMHLCDAGKSIQWSLKQAQFILPVHSYRVTGYFGGKFVNVWNQEIKTLFFILGKTIRFVTADCRWQCSLAGY